MPTKSWNALTDPLQRWDPLSQELAYNNFTDRMKIELPQPGDPAASGVVVVIEPGPVDQTLVKRRFTYNGNADIQTIKTAEVVTASGSPCLLQTFYYNTNYDIDYIIDSLSTW